MAKRCSWRVAVQFLELARFLENRSQLTVVTNSPPVVALLHNKPRITLMSTGGDVMRDTFYLAGNWTERVLNEIGVDKAIMGVTAFDLTYGVSAARHAENAVRRRTHSATFAHKRRKELTFDQDRAQSSCRKKKSTRRCSARLGSRGLGDHRWSSHCGCSRRVFLAEMASSRTASLNFCGRPGNLRLAMVTRRS